VGKKRSVGQDLIDALREANEFHDGKISLRSTELELPARPAELTKKEIKQIRESLKVSQPVFALFLGVTGNAVKSWEQGAAKPNGCALRLLEIAKRHPDDFFRLIG